MSLRVGETGKRIYVITNFDMSANTSLVIYAVPPSGEQNQKTWTATIGGGLSNVTLADGTTVVSVAANESMYYDLASTSDLDESGNWTLVGVYNNTNAGDIFKSPPVTMTVSDDNYAA